MCEKVVGEGVVRERAVCDKVVCVCELCVEGGGRGGTNRQTDKRTDGIERTGPFLSIYNMLETQCHIQTECYLPSAAASIAASASFFSSGDSGVGQSFRSRAGAKLVEDEAVNREVTCCDYTGSLPVHQIRHVEIWL